MKPESLVLLTTLETSTSPLTCGWMRFILWECLMNGAETVSQLPHAARAAQV